MSGGSFSAYADAALKAEVSHDDVPSVPRRRLVLYSHDTQGLGHVRRNIAIAAAVVAATPATDVLLLTGSPEATTLPLPANTDVVTLPTLHKDVNGRYAAKAMCTPLPELLHLRSSICFAALTTFRPDVLIVDKVARGVGGELDASLEALRSTGTRCVLGLREVLDTPAVARQEWMAARTTEAVRDLYDAVWVYGDPTVYDLVKEVGLPAEVAAKVTYTGYLARGRGAGTHPRTRPVERQRPPRRPYVLCLVGGGQDGFEVADAFCRAPMPAGHVGVVLTGPYMRPATRDALHRSVADRGDVTVVEFVPDAERFIRDAAAVVSMAGYNSVCELLAAGARALLLPRTEPRAEQLLRAERLRRHGLADVLPPDAASPQQIGLWLRRAVTEPAPPRSAVDLDGLLRLPGLIQRLIAGRGFSWGADVAV